VLGSRKAEITSYPESVTNALKCTKMSQNEARKCYKVLQISQPPP